MGGNTWITSPSAVACSLKASICVGSRRGGQDVKSSRKRKVAEQEVHGGWREEGKQRCEMMWLTFNVRMVCLAWRSFCLIDSQCDCFYICKQPCFLNIKLNLSSRKYNNAATVCKWHSSTDLLVVLCIRKGDTSFCLSIDYSQSSFHFFFFVFFCFAWTNTAVVFAVSGRITTGPAHREASLEQIIFPALAGVHSAVTQARLHSAWTWLSPDCSVPIQFSCGPAC